MFDFITDSYFWLIASGTGLLGVLSGSIGTFSFLKKESLLGDVIAHSVLPGIALAYILFNSKAIIPLLIGGIIFGWLSTILTAQISRLTKLKPDTTFALILSSFFGLGMMFLSYIQNHPGPNPSGLNHFLFGNAAAITPSEITTILLITILCITLIVLFFKPFSLVCFNPEFAGAIGISVPFYRGFMRFLVILSIAISIQAVGVVMAAALLISPAAAGRMWSNKLSVIVWIGASLGFVSGIFGTLVSYQFSNAPTGPWVVIILSFGALISIFFAPKKGIVALQYQKKRNQKKMDEENILKTLYKLASQTNNEFTPIGIDRLKQQMYLSDGKLKGYLSHLKKSGLLVQKQWSFGLSKTGRAKALKTIRLHRLWELYLTKRLSLPKDHVHNDAEAIEHIITPEIEHYLVKDLGNPTRDPHNSKIPEA
ncbi:MAG: manganese/zinc/iron transport system permease protein [Luteibaculaceae bacterium]|jgi:manganese/zinc/iron transport system permease protein